MSVRPRDLQELEDEDEKMQDSGRARSSRDDNHDNDEDVWDRTLRPFNQEEEEKGQAEDESDEEGKVRAKGVKMPIRPSEAEVREHALTHCPFRSWCTHCVKGQATSHPHRQYAREKGEVRVPTVSLGYMFMKGTAGEG